MNTGTKFQSIHNKTIFKQTSYNKKKNHKTVSGNEKEFKCDNKFIFSLISVKLGTGQYHGRDVLGPAVEDMLTARKLSSY